VIQIWGRAPSPTSWVIGSVGRRRRRNSRNTGTIPGTALSQVCDLTAMRRRSRVVAFDILPIGAQRDRERGSAFGEPAMRAGVVSIGTFMLLSIHGVFDGSSRKDNDK
jgi:hypothetical protein